MSIIYMNNVFPGDRLYIFYQMQKRGSSLKAVCSNLCSESYAYILLLFNEFFYYYLYLLYYLFLQFL